MLIAKIHLNQLVNNFFSLFIWTTI